MDKICEKCGAMRRAWYANAILPRGCGKCMELIEYTDEDATEGFCSCGVHKAIQHHDMEHEYKYVPYEEEIDALEKKIEKAIDLVKNPECHKCHNKEEEQSKVDSVMPRICGICGEKIYYGVTDPDEGVCLCGLHISIPELGGCCDEDGYPEFSCRYQYISFDQVRKKIQFLKDKLNDAKSPMKFVQRFKKKTQHSTPEAEQKILAIINEFEHNSSSMGAPYDKILLKAKEIGISTELSNVTINSLFDQGIIYEPKIGYIKSVDIPLTKKNNAESKSAYTEKSLPSLEFLMEKIIFFDERIRKLELALEKVERASSKNS